jgi:hypothetical protein
MPLNDRKNMNRCTGPRYEIPSFNFNTMGNPVRDRERQELDRRQFLARQAAHYANLLLEAENNIALPPVTRNPANAPAPPGMNAYARVDLPPTNGFPAFTFTVYENQNTSMTAEAVARRLEQLTLDSAREQRVMPAESLPPLEQKAQNVEEGDDGDDEVYVAARGRQPPREGEEKETNDAHLTP